MGAGQVHRPEIHRTGHTGIPMPHNVDHVARRADRQCCNPGALTARDARPAATNR